MFKKILAYLALLFFIFFEVYAGVRLLTSPTDFTNSVIVIFGVVMLIVGIVSLVRAFQIKNSGLPYRLGLFGGILDLIIGAVCLFLSDKVLALFPVMVMIYGVIMVVFGINKIRNYLVLKDFGIHRSWLVILSAIVTIVLGVLVFLNPFTATETAWTATGIFLIIEGIIDLFTFIFSFFF